MTRQKRVAQWMGTVRHHPAETRDRIETDRPVASLVSTGGRAMPSTKEAVILTIAAIRKTKGETQYLFSEKQAIFRLAGGAKTERTKPGAANASPESATRLKKSQPCTLPPIA